MKKFLSLILCAMMVLTLVACGSKDGGNAGGSKEGDTMDLTAMVDKLYEGIASDNMPMVMTQEVTEDLFEGVFFIPAVKGEAVMSEPMMSSIAHSVCLVRVAEGTDVEATRAAIEANMNPRKWCCVEAEKSGVIANGNTILLVMCAEANYQTIVDNFNALWA